MPRSIDPRRLVNYKANRLYLDYIEERGTLIKTYFTHAPNAFHAAFAARRAEPYPRQKLVEVLKPYNASHGAGRRALENIEALAEPTTFCVVSGQQAGFLGGAAYTAHKIITTIRLAARLEEYLGGRFVPLFWLASEDHDFGEINHAYLTQPDGEVGQVSFGWRDKGRPIADLPLTEAVAQAYDEYFERLLPGPFHAEVKERFAPQPDETYCAWHARIWAELFADQGLVIVEPHVLRPLGGDVFHRALSLGVELHRHLDDVARRLELAGYQPALAPGRAGDLYTFDKGGQRVRIETPEVHLDQVSKHPERYSADAALRPLFADRLLPTVASVLGPGEIAYQAMLKPLYKLFELPQPILFPRKSYTVLSSVQAERLADYDVDVPTVLRGELDIGQAFEALLPTDPQALFDQAREASAQALEPLRAYVEGIDPSLVRTWEQTLYYSQDNLDKLEARAMKARMSQEGLSKAQLRSLRNALLPRGRLQERVFPLPHFLNQFGFSFLDELLSIGELDDFSHHILTLEVNDVER